MQFWYFTERYSGNTKKHLHQRFYRLIARLDHDRELTLMNYGYDGHHRELPLPETVERYHRLALQLYDCVAGGIDLAGKDVLEVGSGRGGGASFVAEHHQPRSMVGMDFTEGSVIFSNQQHSVPNLRFAAGDAENLPFASGSFDAVINVESSHCYGDMHRFLCEAHRVLRDGGSLLWADSRFRDHVPWLLRRIESAGFAVAEQVDITANVLASMDYRSERNRDMVRRFVPWFLRGIFYGFAGVQGKANYNRLKFGKAVYLRMVLNKQA